MDDEVNRKKSKKSKKSKEREEEPVDEVRQEIEENESAVDQSVKKSKKKKKSKDRDEEEGSGDGTQKDVDQDEENSNEKKKKRKHKKDKYENENDDDKKNNSREDNDEPKVKEKKEKEIENDEKQKDEELNVHSANNWEKVDLGDEERKKKFLKLMGATKHKDADDADTTHKHYRTKNETEKVNKDLEKQFTEGITNKVQHRVHCGLGFSDPKSTSNSNQTQSNEDKFSKYKKMNFVKSKD